MIKILILVLLAGAIWAQTPKMEWNKGYGTDNGEHINEIMQTSDGGFIGIGQTNESGAHNYDILVIKTDPNGDFQWQKIIGTQGENDIGICVEQAADGYVIGGASHNGNQQRYMAKLDYNGEFIWQKNYRLPMKLEKWNPWNRPLY